MYISLILLWLCFKIIDGEIIHCPIGGLTNKGLCENLNKDSVMNKFYIPSFKRHISVNKKNKCDTLDNPYNGFVCNYENKYKEITESHHFQLTIFSEYGLEKL
ncbi:uncharacterized protein LOC112595100 [Melanaphis sacchari]|uniref:uncharacterized protein LOC112595100 n=1 Tax=Melanaphis sacchari TaxID=742174 RepID=UPI000DC15001|nr:uncharacterized protein LOC112595100 [Melanaphis sacchari]